MKVEIQLPQHGVEANVTCYGSTGQRVQVSKIVVEPIFHDPKQRAPVLYATTSVPADAEAGSEEDADEASPEEVLQRFVLALPGSSGKAQIIDRSKQVTPHVVAKRKKPMRAPATPPTPPESSTANAEGSDEDIIELPDS